MRYTTVEECRNPLSDIVFGCCNPLMIDGNPQAIKVLNDAYERGFNIFDTARVYGQSERTLGKWIKERGNREQITIISKGCHPDEHSRLNTNALKADVETSLEELGTDYIDIYMLHRDDENADIEAILKELNKYINDGVIRSIGVSNWNHLRIEKANALAKEMGVLGFDFSSPQLSIARMLSDPWGGGCVSISYEEEAASWYTLHPEVKVMAYSCLGRGLFSGKVKSRRLFTTKKNLDYAAKVGFWGKENLRRLKVAEKIASEKGCSVAQIAIAWCLNQPFKVFPIVTVSSEKRIIENIDALEIELTNADLERLR